MYSYISYQQLLATYAVDIFLQIFLLLLLIICDYIRYKYS